MRNRYQIGLAAAALVLALPATVAQADSGQKMPMTSHAPLMPDAVRWGPPPASVMVGAPPEEFLKQAGFEVAVLSGDPSKAGAVYSIRFRCGDGFRVAPHWHPTDEHLTVIQGTFGVGDGDVWDKTKGQEMKAGAYALMPANMHHFGWCQGATIVQAHGIGPFKIHWLNPAIKGAK